MNHRFVAYYFNRSGMGKGGSAAAAAFTKDKPGNPYAYLAAYLPDGTYLGEPTVYADKVQVFRWLRSLLAAHPEQSAWTQPEKSIRAAAKSARGEALLQAARLHEALGQRPEALALYQSRVLMQGALGDEARRGAWRLLRAEQDWSALEKALTTLGFRAPDVPRALRTDWLVERSHLLLARGESKAAQALLRPRVRALDDHPRAAELHFALGRACWFLEERDWARFHWMWIWHKRPEDRLAMRAKIAAAALIMPYPNPELGGYEATGSIGPQHIEAEHERSRALYRRLSAPYARGDWGGPRAEKAKLAKSDDPRAWALALRDGNQYVAQNNKLVEKLVAVGESALLPLAEALCDREGLGRGYAGWALGKVIQATGKSPAAVRRALVIGLQDPSAYVSGLTRSGLEQSGLSWADLADAVKALEKEEAERRRAGGESVPWEGDDPALLAGRLRDGNRHRIVNNRIVARLVALGAPSVEPLMARVRDRSFSGRGYAAWALASVLKPLEKRPEAALRLLRDVAAGADGYVKALAESGLRSLK